MKRFIWIAVVPAMVLWAGCTGLTEQQRGAYVGNSDTKVYYKNLGKYESAIPQEKRVYFRGVDAAMEAGYHSSQEAGEAPQPNADQ